MRWYFFDIDDLYFFYAKIIFLIDNSDWIIVIFTLLIVFISFFIAFYTFVPKACFYSLINGKIIQKNLYKYSSQNCEFTNEIFFAWKYCKIRSFWQFWDKTLTVRRLTRIWVKTTFGKYFPAFLKLIKNSLKALKVAT